MAYYYDELVIISSFRGSYWLSGFNCTGDEVFFLECFNNIRLNFGNCSFFYIVFVLCFNDIGEFGKSFKWIWIFMFLYFLSGFILLVLLRM